MAKNIYVGNLSYNVSEDELRNLFGEFGEVTAARVITDNQTGRSKGFGFVEMSSDEEAEAAIAAMDGKEVDGRPMKVNEAQPKQDRPKRGGFGGGGGGRGGRGGFGGGGGGRDRGGRGGSSGGGGGRY